RNISVSDLEIMSSGLGFVNTGKEATVAEEMVKKLGVKCNNANQLVKSLSGGNQQKVVLAKWLLRNPSILLLDEPTRGIDVGSKDEIYERISELSEQGISILLLSSEMPEVMSLAHRIIIMKDGEIQGEIPGLGATQNDILLIASGEKVK
ncbi:MAG: sugar ABC transporter ATP-binding protein, partial [Lachnospiraceae bacterium]|nr:sugar ABC transporter ATP-binding protein [Candidatus Equihabitans merdae]